MRVLVQAPAVAATSSGGRTTKAAEVIVEDGVASICKVRKYDLCARSKWQVILSTRRGGTH